MSIPEISRSNVLAAIERVQREGVPRNRRSRRYFLLHKDQRFPPKYVVSLAVQDATGQELDPQEFSGGDETNRLLGRLGFSVAPFSKDAADNADTPQLNKKIFNGNTDLGSPSPATAQKTPLIGRVVVCGRPRGRTDGEAMLLDVLKNRWTRGQHLKFLITPGGFVEAPFPPTWRGGVSWDSKPDDLKALAKYAEDALSRILTKRVRKAAEGKIDVLTVGIDLCSEDFPEHAELVAVYEFANERISWTGKSYPTSHQERKLVQVIDLNTHLLAVADERVLVLGCHDLNMFSPRVKANVTCGSNRSNRCQKMKRLAREFKPTIVLHHPHSTDSPNIWRTAWAGPKKIGKLKAWASGIAYHNPQGKPRKPLKCVLAATQGGAPCVDFELC